MKLNFFAILLAGVATCLIASAPAKDEAAKKDKDKIHGTWRAVTGEIASQQIPEEALKGLDMTLEFKEDKYTFKTTTENETGTFKIDPDKQPKTLTFKIESGEDKDKTQLGIYTFEDGKLKICVVKAGEKERPTEFKTKEGTTQSLFVFKKQE